MPIQQRHKLVTVGAVNQGAFSDAVSVEECDSFIISLTSDAQVTLVVDGSNDGGTTWYEFDRSLISSALDINRTYSMPVPGTIRIGATTTGTGNFTAIYLDLLREVC